MEVTVTIHDAWLARPDALQRAFAILSGLEVPPHSEPARQAVEPPGQHQDREEQRPNGRAPARPTARPDRGDAWEPEDEEERAPADGRQLLGWASKQVPDQKGSLISYGKKNGLHTKIVSWSPDQVDAAYRHARGLLSTTR